MNKQNIDHNMEIPKKIVFISAQPDEIYFHWQVELYLHNFYKKGIPKDQCFALFGIKDEPSEYIVNLKKNNPGIYWYRDDRDQSVKYLSSVRPNILKKFFSDFPEKGSYVFYHDSDILFNKLPPFRNMLDDDICYLSDTNSYISYDYIKDCCDRYKEVYSELSKTDLLDKMAESTGISPLLIKENNKNSGGAQYFLKDVTVDYWTSVERDSINLYQLMLEYEQKYPIKKPIQKWTADMWAVLWNLWKVEKNTLIHNDLSFSWATSKCDDEENGYDSHNIFHLAGVTKEFLDSNPDYFYKGKNNKRNIIELLKNDINYFDFVNPNNSSGKYIENAIEYVSEKYNIPYITDEKQRSVQNKEQLAAWGEALDIHLLTKKQIKPAEGTALFFIEDQGVLFCELTSKIYHINELATYIWCLLEGNFDARSIIQAIQKTYNISEKTSEEYLAQTIQIFFDLHVLDGSQKTMETFNGDASLSLIVPVVTFVAERYFCLLGSVILIRFSSIEQLNHVVTVFKHLACSATSHPDIKIDIVASDNGKHILCRDGAPYNTCSCLSQLAPLAKALLWAAALNHYDYFINIHAGVVGDGSVCYLFPASPGSGKTTLVAALANHSFEFFSDEMALIEKDTFMVSPAPLAICVKSTGIKPLLGYYPELTSEISHQRGDGKVVQYVSPPVGSVPLQSVRRPITAIIFPQYNPEAVTRMVPVNKLDALKRLSEQFLVVTKRLDKQILNQLIDWLENTPCFELSLSDTNEAITLIKELSH